MKKAFTFALALLAAASAWAYDFKSGDLYYNITDEAAKTVEVTYEYEFDPSNYSSLPGVVTIPETVSYNGTEYSVTSIGSRAFNWCSALTQVTIPNGVTSIEGHPFFGCYALTAINVESGNTVYCSDNGILFNKEKTILIKYPIGKPGTTYTIPDGVNSIRYGAFEDCSALMQITIPSSVESIEDSAFFGTALYSNAENWTNNVLYIDNCLISAKTELGGSYEIAAGTRVIADGAFSNCSALTHVTIPESLTSIGEDAFFNCSKITAVYYTGDVAEWCGIAFDNPYSNPLVFAHSLYIGNTLVTKLAIPEGVTEIKDYAFRNCEAITQVTIGNSVTNIGNEAFYNCSAITAVYYTGDVTEWCNITFYDSYSNPLYYAHNLYIDNYLVTELVIPESVTEIKNYAFRNCKAITQVTIGNSVKCIGNEAFHNCSAITEVNIGNNVTSIGEWTFSSCSALTQVTIGNNMEHIGYGAFWNCSALTEITVLATVPPTVGADAFYNVSRNIPVFVPAEALEDYQAAETWKEFNYLQAIQTDLQTPSMPESINVYGGILHNPQQLPVSLYDMQGRMVYSGTAATVSQPAGVYVLRCAGASSKVLF